MKKKTKKKQDVATAIPKADTKRDEIHSINSLFVILRAYSFC